MPSWSTALVLALAGSALSSPLDLATRQASFSGTTQNFTPGVCKSTMIVFARGTTEGGNVGSLAGPQFFQAVAKANGGDLAVQGVAYPADIPGFLAGGDKGGSQNMAKITTQAIQDCPNSTIIMSGYSQGGQLCHNAAKMMSPDMQARVGGAVIFGDPDNGSPVGNIDKAKTKVICHATDNICQHGDLILAAHLTYGGDAGDAAKFVMSVAGKPASKVVKGSTSAAGSPPGTGQKIALPNPFGWW